ncbi:MAG: ATP synthase F1 subunit epsilon [Treponema sp.]|jgi:F-type H+-transporting ATPase subunit epsilon|nr:ATP synthase F1 subunit epsilon [Treponema sp.]
MTTLFSFEVYTPNRIFCSESVEAIVLSLIDGDVGIYANHAFLTAPVVPCLLNIKDKDGKWKTAFTAEGILEVTHHKTVLVSDAAEWPSEIDYERALKAKERAEESIQFAGNKFETDNAATSLRRAIMRIMVWEEGQKKS